MVRQKGLFGLIRHQFQHVLFCELDALVIVQNSSKMSIAEGAAPKQKRSSVRFEQKQSP